MAAADQYRDLDVQLHVMLLIKTVHSDKQSIKLNDNMHICKDIQDITC